MQIQAVLQLVLVVRLVERSPQTRRSVESDRVRCSAAGAHSPTAVDNLPETSGSQVVATTYQVARLDCLAGSNLVAVLPWRAAAVDKCCGAVVAVWGGSRQVYF